MKRSSTAILALIASCSLLLSACGGSSASAASSAAVYYEEKAAMDTASPMGNTFMAAPAPMAPVMEADMGEAGISTDAAAPMPSPAAEDRKIIKHGNLSLETLEFDTALDSLRALIAEKGGYIESENVDGRSLHNRDNYYSRTAHLTARIPAERLGEVTEGAGRLCNIVSRGESMDDITDSYFDAKAHLDSLRLQEERLLDILGKAEKLEEVIQLESALSNVRYEIESLTASLKRMDSRVAYSDLTLELREVNQYQETAAAPKTFGEKLSAAGGRSVSHLVNAVQGLLLFTVENLPVLLLWAALILVIVLAVRAVLRARKRRVERGFQKRMESAVSPEPKADDTPKE